MFLGGPKTDISSGGANFPAAGEEPNAPPPPSPREYGRPPGGMAPPGPPRSLLLPPPPSFAPLFGCGGSRPRFLPGTGPRLWASTMEGHGGHPEIRLAHAGGGVAVGPISHLTRQEREAQEGALLAAGATRASGSGQRALPE